MINFAELLTTEQKRSLLEQRIAQFASEGYQHELNKQTSELANDEIGIEASNAAIETISNAIAVHQQELEGLEN